MNAPLTKPFELLDPADRERLLSLGARRTLMPGARLIAEGEVGRSFYILLAGELEVSKDGESVARIGSGELVGEMSLFNDSVRTSDVLATSESEVLEILHDDFQPLVLHQDGAAISLMQLLGQVMMARMQEQERRLSDELGSVASEFSALKSQLMSDWALRYHAFGRPGKLEIRSTKPSGTAADLSVAYSPGVADPCIEIAKDREKAWEYTARGQLVGVITNGTAVLGLGNIGPDAAKPVMEGKAVLFKRFADVDAVDIEVDALDPEKLAEIVCALAPTFGGINLEDIRAPDCFLVERVCDEKLDIPVFHDDQHGTAMVAGAALLNALSIIDKRIEDIKVVFSGAGAAGFATARLFVTLGVQKSNLILTDIDGVVYTGRSPGSYLAELESDTEARTLAEALVDADVFVGVSVGGVMKPTMLQTMNRDPLVFAMANPTPEIHPRIARETRSDVIMGTGRSDYPNQINNVTAFPYIFRAALDVRATTINPEMKIAATRAIAALARQPIDAAAGFDGRGLSFGRDYLVPKPFDRRLLFTVAPAVAEAAMESGVAKRTCDLDAYRNKLVAQSKS